MRILLANSTLSLLAGSETHTATLARQLKRVGHEVYCFSPKLGVISDGLAKDGIRSTDSLFMVKPFSIVLEPEFPSSFDLILSSHHDVTSFLRGRFPDARIISTIHGVIHKMIDDNGREVIAPEHPAVGKADVFVSVSEEVQNVLRNEYGIESTIIRNSFDLEKMMTDKKPNLPKPKQFLINTNYSLREDNEVQLIKRVADYYGAKLAAVGQNFVQTPDVREAIEASDVVVGMGRSVLEGVAMGRLGIVHGRWGTGGIICEESVDVLRKCNFSGRNSGGDFWTFERLVKEIDRLYTAENMEWGRNYVESEHDISKAVENYLNLGGENETNVPVRKAKFQSGHYA